MKDIAHFIKITVQKTGQKEELVEKVIRNMFADVQNFTNKKRGVNIQIPHIGTFIFRATAIPSFIGKQKAILAHWIMRLFKGQDKLLEKTTSASIRNINLAFDGMKQVSLIKQEYLKRHATYRPKTRVILQNDSYSDLGRVEEYIITVKTQLGLQEGDYLEEGNLPKVPV